MNALVVAFRVIRVQVHVLQGVVTVALVLPWASPERRRRIIQQWARQLMKHLRVQVQIHGNLPRPESLPVVLTSNHVSWVDIFTIHTMLPVRFVSKSEVRNWPVFGWLAAKTGTLFLVRASARHTAEIGKQMEDALSQGDCLGLFPESTTSSGEAILPFRSSLLQAAVNSQSQLLPIALFYRLNDGKPNPHIPFVGEMTFVQSLLLVAKSPPSWVEIHVGSPLSPAAQHRRTLAQQLESATRDLLQSARNRSD